MQKKPWKIIVFTERLGGGPGTREFFIVKAPDAGQAVKVLHIFRPDLGDARIEVKGEAPPEFLDWFGVEGDVYSIQVLSP
jgi:hypothetical protein